MNDREEEPRALRFCLKHGEVRHLRQLSKKALRWVWICKSCLRESGAAWRVDQDIDRAIERGSE